MAIRLEEGDTPFVPSMLTRRDEFTIIGEQVKQIQAEMFRLEVIMHTNGHREIDLVPGSDQAYKTQFDVYKAGLKRIEVCYPDFIDSLLGAQRGV